MRVSICGPNLRDQSKGQFHVHAANCTDLTRNIRREPEYRNGWEMDAASRVEVCDAIYPPEDFECESGDYLDDLHFFPCTKGLDG